jgi:hypothetical protein
MKDKNIAVLLAVKEKLSKDKLKLNKKEEKFATPVAKPTPYGGRLRVAVVDAGRDEWISFKRECVLLKGEGK